MSFGGAHGDDVYRFAVDAIDAGLCVLPPREDGTKAPDSAEWTSYQKDRSTHEEVEQWYASGRTGLGILTGAVSGSLELLDFDDAEAYERFTDAARASGMAELVERIEDGYLERTPNGIHWFYRCEEIAGNTKLASRLKKPEEKRDPEDKIKALIETRGEGGYAVTAPSFGRVHPSGGAYRRERGSFGTIATITPEERRALHDLARSFDEMPRREPKGEPRTRTDEKERPGDRFNREADWMDDILGPAGWTFVYERGAVKYVRRPGKEFGISASINATGKDTLIVFSTSTPLEIVPASHSKFSAYAVLHHGGDFAAAARALSEKYGMDGGAQTRGVRADEPWEEPVEFSAESYGPPVPLEAFPSEIGDYAQSLAEVHEVPVDFLMAAAHGALAAGCAGRAEVAIGKTHQEPLNLYLAPVLPSGERKQVARALFAPIQVQEVLLVEQNSPEIARLRKERAVREKRIKVLEDQAAKAEGRFEREKLIADAVKLELELPVVPVLPRLLLDDATTEATAKALCEQDGVISVFSEEAGGLFEMLLGRYKDNVADLDLHLKAYDGGDVRVDRIGREPLLIHRPALTIVVTPQPAILDRLASRPELRDRGLLARFCFVLPPSLVGTRTYRRNGEIDPAGRRAYEETLRAILWLPTYSASARGEGKVPRLRLEGKALALWADYADEFEKKLGEGGKFAGLPDWGSKHSGRAARFAGQFHLARRRAAEVEAAFKEPIAEETVAMAWAAADWYGKHALVAFGRMAESGDVRLAKRILGWIRRHGPRAFSLRELHQHHREVDRPEDLQVGLSLLEERGFIRRQPPPEEKGRGRPRSPVFVVNPLTRGVAWKAD